MLRSFLFTYSLGSSEKTSPFGRGNRGRFAGLKARDQAGSSRCTEPVHSLRAPAARARAAGGLDARDLLELLREHESAVAALRGVDLEELHDERLELGGQVLRDGARGSRLRRELLGDDLVTRALERRRPRHER